VTDSDGLWTACADSIRSQVTDGVWQSTFRSITPVAFDGSVLTVVVPSSYIRERLEGKWSGLVGEALEEAGGPGTTMKVVVIAPPAPEPEPGERDTSDGATSAASGGQAPNTSPFGSGDHAGGTAAGTGNGTPFGRGTGSYDAAPSGSVPGTGLNEKYRFEAFVIGQSNRFAHAAALGVAERPGHSYNPLFIYGKAGLGKTHLLQAIGHFVRATYPALAVKYVSTETFMNEFVEAIRTNAPTNFKRRYRQVDVLLVDDVQFMEGKEGLQEEFFHTFNELQQANGQVVLTSDRPPDNMRTLEDRLRSRFKSGLITDIQPPDLETRTAILQKKVESSKVAVPADVLEFIAEHITDNIRELEGALIRLIAWSNLNSEPLSVDRAREQLAGTLASNQPLVITPTMIIKATCTMYDLERDDLCGKSRRRPLVNARQVAMYVMRELTDLSYPAIGREFGGRDHTTVMHAVEKITSLMNQKHSIFDSVNRLIISIRNGDYA